MTTCAIHQPNFFPWLGYFDKIRQADVFVFLDRVPYPKSGSSMSSWCNRVKLNVHGTATWVSAAVRREHGVQMIDSVKLNEERPWRAELRALLVANYGRARNFERTMALLEPLLAFATDSLADFNINAVQTIARHLGYGTRFVRQSALPPIEESATARLVALTRGLGADTYLCGGGAGGYQDDAAFGAAGLNLVYQEFTPTPYGDPAAFLPGLSVIDWLMHAGDS